MRRLLPLAALLLATIAATPAAAWDRPHHGGWGWRPAPAWHHAPPHRGWHQPWGHDRRWYGHGRDHRPRHAWRHYRHDGWGYRRGW